MFQRHFFSCCALGLLTLSLTACGGGGGGGGSQSGGSSSGLGAFVLTVTAGDASNSLTWSAPTVPAGMRLTGYDIKRSGDPNTPPTAVIASVGPDMTAATDSQVTAGTTYFYKITARTDAGTTMDSQTPPPLPSPQPASGSSLPYSDSATPGGPSAVGLGDPATCNNGPCQPPEALFQATSYALNTSVANPGGSGFVLNLTLNRPAAASDLQSVQLEGRLYTRANTPQFAAGISLPTANGLQFDSVKAGITLPAGYLPLTGGGYYSLTATLADGGVFKRLEFTADAPAVTAAQPFGNNTRTISIGPPDGRSFTMTVTVAP